MHYEFNVSLNGKHFFATAERSCRDKEPALAVYNALREAFKTKDGYLITVTQYETVGYRLTEKDLLAC